MANCIKSVKGHQNKDVAREKGKAKFHKETLCVCVFFCGDVGICGVGGILKRKGVLAQKY